MKNRGSTDKGILLLRPGVHRDVVDGIKAPTTDLPISPTFAL